MCILALVVTYLVDSRLDEIHFTCLPPDLSRVKGMYWWEGVVRTSGTFHKDLGPRTSLMSDLPSADRLPRDLIFSLPGGHGPTRIPV